MIKDRYGKIVEPEELLSKIDKNGRMELIGYTFENKYEFLDIPDSCHSVAFTNCMIDCLELSGASVCNFSFDRCIVEYMRIDVDDVNGILIKYSNVSIIFPDTGKIKIEWVRSNSSYVSIVSPHNIYKIKHVYSTNSKIFLGGNDDIQVEDFECDHRSSGLYLTCPECGSFIGWKKCAYEIDVPDYLIAKLLIPADAKRSSSTTRKCRASKVIVLEMQNSNGKVVDMVGTSFHDPRVKYKTGETIEVPDFDENRWNECSTGIHFFITREEAVNY